MSEKQFISGQNLSILQNGFKALEIYKKKKENDLKLRIIYLCKTIV